MCVIQQHIVKKLLINLHLGILSIKSFTLFIWEIFSHTIVSKFIKNLFLLYARMNLTPSFCCHQECIRTGGQRKSVYFQQKPVVRSKLLNCTKNRTPSHMLSSNGLCLCAAAQYVLLFLVQFNNSDWFQIYRVTRSSSSRLFLCTLVS